MKKSLKRFGGIRSLICLTCWLVLALPTALHAEVTISEFMAVNHSTIADEDGDFSDWIEIFNSGPGTVDLNGWALSNDKSVPFQWQFPSTNLNAGEFLVVFASGKDRRIPGAPLHTNFKLNSDGDYLALVSSNGTITSEFSPAFPKQRTDVSYGVVSGAGTNGFLLPPTPGATNVSTAALFVSDTKFSHGRGLYSTNFNLVISCDTPDAAIYFTTNGSSPGSTNGFLYSTAIPISSTTVIRARAEKSGYQPSNVDTLTYIFLSDVLTQSPDEHAPPGWPTSWGDNMVDYGMDPNIVNVAPWSGTISNDLRAIPSMSLVMALPDLFDATNGIYANALQDGVAWERPGSLELIYPDGKSGFQIDSGVRIRGGWSRQPLDPKHSFRFLLKDEYGDSKLKYPLFGSGAAAKCDRFDLRTAQDNSWAYTFDPNGLFVNDSFARKTQLALGQPAERGDWYHLYINGQYWGIYNTCERPEAGYAANYFGGSPLDYDVLKPDPNTWYSVFATDGNDTAWTQLWEAATNGFASNSDYFSVQGRDPDGTVNPALTNLLDVGNLVDYMLTTFWIGNIDGPINIDGHHPNNFFAIRSRKNTAGFRFIMHDSEGSLYDVTENRIQTTDIGDPSVGDGADRNNPQYLWTRLLPNPEFQQLVADRVQKYFFGNGALTTEACTARFLECTAEIDRAIVGESARWGDAKGEPQLTRDDWINAVNDKLTNYFLLRSGIVLTQLKNAGLFPSLSAPAFSQNGGEVPVGFSLALSHTNSQGTIYYTIDGSDPRSVGGSLNSTALSYSGSIPITTSTQIRARVKDGASWSPIIEATFYPSQDYTGLTVTELMYNPLPSGAISGNEFEFLELKNTGTNVLDLGGAFFSGIIFTFTNGTVLTPGQFFVLVRNATQFAARYPGIAYQGIYTGKLDNGGEAISLTNALGVQILSVTYNNKVPWPAAADGFGFSIVPVSTNGAADPNDGRQWRASGNAGGSPGADDVAANIPRVVINEILTHTDPPQSDSIELLNLTTNLADISGWYLTDDPAVPRKFCIPNGTTIPAGSFVYFTETNFNTGSNAFNLSSVGESVVLFSGSASGTNLTGYTHGLAFGAAANGISFGRYVNSVGEELFPAQITNTFGMTNSGPRVGPVVINEIQYHPQTNYDEFIEILNITGSAVNLFDAAHPTNLWKLNGIGFTFPTNVALPAGGLALIVGIDPTLFRTKYNVPTNVPVWGPYTGVLQDSGERLELQRPDNPNLDGSVPYITVDEVRYNDHAPWPIAADGDGPSLQRFVASAYGNDPTNWFANGFTPGTTASLNQAPTAALVTPTEGATYLVTLPVTLTAQAADADGSILRVEFFDGLVKIGEVTNTPYTLEWQPASSGTHLLSVQAYDNQLASGSSPVTTITVNEPEPVTPPELQLLLAASAIQLGFTAQAGASYTVESCTNLASGDWELWTNLPAVETNRTIQFSLPVENVPSRFFRVVVP